MWMNQSSLTRLNRLADFTMHLMYNSLPKKRITAGERVFVFVVYVSLVHHEKSAYTYMHA